MPILNWLTRDQDTKAAAKVPYRLLEEVPEHSAGASDTGNMLIQGDNLEALKALLPFYAGRVKCIYIDPPYNTGAAFEHYDDNLENSIWLGTIWPRLELLRDLLAEDGSIWVNIDDRQGHYLKVILDEVFGRSRFVANIVWQKRTSRENRKAIGSAHDHILVYAPAGAQEWKKHRNLLPDTEKGYANPDQDPKGPWRSIPFSAQGFRKNQMYKITTPTGDVLDPPKGRCWGATEPEFIRLRDIEKRVYFPKNGRGRPRIKKYQFEESGLAPMTWWTAAEFGDNQQAKKEILELFNDEEAFDTPKPEKLIERILHIATNPGDVVLDSFLGSGTTMAVAIKTGRRSIGIEMGDHAVTYCAPRLRNVINGEQGGISQNVAWQGGGGFRFYRLGPPVFDEEGHIRSDIRFPVLASHIWFSEADRPWDGDGNSPLLGIHDGRAYALLYNGILGDKRPQGGNVLTRATLAVIRTTIADADPSFAKKNPDYPLTVYGEQSRLTPATLDREQITFKQTPYDVKART
ncbi:site-specific DNA-methyltransferase [Thalassospira xiamenensis]|uniref:site-specific DNA-methyltransferase (adenine-specific) n=1 Tax=Thalassospira xiamenensis TaxID=220697 RepID=A0A285RTH6_9PROT|nr:site-specific DNA-methyltransferase [Thalassospira xiamenensis]SOB97174.1 adenine-specific DNA-methyltransferase [Thalassospira xiamenensis]